MFIESEYANEKINGFLEKSTIPEEHKEKLAGFYRMSFMFINSFLTCFQTATDEELNDFMKGCLCFAGGSVEILDLLYQKKGEALFEEMYVIKDKVDIKEGEVLPDIHKGIPLLFDITARFMRHCMSHQPAEEFQISAHEIIKIVGIFSTNN
jgi:hypothetical protein